VTTYEDIGGAAAVSAAVDDLYERLLADPTLAPYFTDVSTSKLKGHQRAFITVAIGGPDTYTGRSMCDAHAGLDITPEAFAAVVDHLVTTLAGLGVSADAIGEIAGKLAPLESDIVTAR
jgi:hemoglobin